MMCRRCCLIHSGQGAGASASAVRAAAHRLQQLSQAPAPFQRAASEMTDMLLPVPSAQEVLPPSWLQHAAPQSISAKMHLQGIASKLGSPNK